MGNILIIDDDAEVRDTLLTLTRRMRMSGEAVGTLREGIVRLRRGGVDVVFLDVTLPDGNGLDALSEIKALPDSPEVIILTGRGDPDGAELAIQGGVWDYLLKPSPIKDTMLTLERALKYRTGKRGACNPWLCAWRTWWARACPCAPASTPWLARPAPAPACSSQGRPAPARNSSPAPST